MPITIVPAIPRALDCVLIDDDVMVRMNWRHSARKAGRNLKTFQSPTSFFDCSDFLPKTTLIYIDSHLRDGIRGELIAKEIHQRGFENIFLTTGDSPSEFSNMPWLKEIVDKRPPWKGKAKREKSARATSEVSADAGVP